MASGVDENEVAIHEFINHIPNDHNKNEPPEDVWPKNGQSDKTPEKQIRTTTNYSGQSQKSTVNRRSFLWVILLALIKHSYALTSYRR